MNKIIKNVRAFTLLELLIVVLIIGILAAVAVPQYRKVILKSRLIQVQLQVKTLIDLMELDFLRTGQYPADTQYPGDFQLPECSLSNGVFYCPQSILDYGNGSQNIVGGFLRQYQGLAYIQYPRYAFPTNKRNVKECWADSSNTTANQVCRSLGGVPNGSSIWRVATFDHTRDNWNIYTLP